MSTREKLIKARMGMLALAEELQNVSVACKRAGISRSHYYEIKEAFGDFFGPFIEASEQGVVVEDIPEAGGNLLEADLFAVERL